jgi:hypothetical protein
MGATQGKSKKEQKEAAREWAMTKENEVAELYAQNTELRNQILMMQEDMRALRDMLKGQQSALNESVKQIEERMTEMENDVKVVPFCGYPGLHSSNQLLSTISSHGEQHIYYRNEIGDDNDSRAWEKEEKRKNYTTSYMMIGRVYSLKQFEKVYVGELKFKKITCNQYGDKYRKWNSQGRSGYVHGLPKLTGEQTLQFPNFPCRTYDSTRIEPDEE